MTLLESAMAFAVVMIIFSTLVTGIVEAILRSVGTREKNLQKTIEALFDKVVWPRLEEGLSRINLEETGNTGNSDQQANNHKENFVRDLTENPVFQPASKWSVERKSKIDALSLLAFAERLGKSDVGKAIAAESEAQVKLLVTDLARSFSRFGRAASEVFRKKAQLTAICVAIPLAWIANIDAARLLDQLINNPDIRTSLIEQAEAAHGDNKAATLRLKELEVQIESYHAQHDPDPAKTPAAGEPVDAGTLQQQLKEVSGKLEQSIKNLEDQGLEIGWQFYPYCGEGHADEACNGRVGRKKVDGTDASILDIASTVDFVLWFFMSTLAGVLIGLGGPFWFSVFTSLSQVFQALKALSPGGRKPAKDEPPPPEKIAEDLAKPKDVLDAFNVAVEVNLQSSPEAS